MDGYYMASMKAGRLCTSCGNYSAVLPSTMSTVMHVCTQRPRAAINNTSCAPPPEQLAKETPTAGANPPNSSGGERRGDSEVCLPPVTPHPCQESVHISKSF